MAKAILEFDLPEEGDDFELAVKGREFMLTLWDLDQWLRNELKHGSLSVEEYASYDRVRTVLHDLMADYKIQFS